MPKNLYRIEVVRQYVVVAEDEEQARETYDNYGGDLEDEYVMDVYFLTESEED